MSENDYIVPERFGMTKDGELILVMPTNVILIGEVLWKTLQWDYKNSLSIEGELKIIPEISEIVPCVVLRRRGK